MKVVITGANGFVGRALLSTLFGGATGVTASWPYEEAPDVHVLLRTPRSMQELQGDFPQVRAQLIAGTIADIERTLHGAQVVVHLAWSTVPVSANADPVNDLRANVSAGLHLLEACGRAGIGRFIFLSSGGTVYGAKTRAPHRETDPLDPVGAYGCGKACMEHYVHLRAAHHGFASTVLRPGNLYGSPITAKKDQGVVEHWMDKLRANRAIEVWNGFDVVRDYVHIDDMVGAIIAAMGPRALPSTLNVGTGTGTSLGELRDLLFQITGRRVPVIAHGTQAPAVPWNVLDTTLASIELKGYRPMELATGLERLWQFRSVSP